MLLFLAQNSGVNFVFYDLFKSLCKEKGVSVTKATVDIGLSRTIGTKWKNTGATPHGEALNKIASYFGVSVDYLLGNEQKNKPAQNVQVRDENDNIVVLDDETREMIDSLRRRPDMKILFSVSKGATPEDIITAVKIIEALKNKGEGDH